MLRRPGEAGRASRIVSSATARRLKAELRVERAVEQVCEQIARASSAAEAHIPYCE